jgi:carotenoid cleavage dioxygenase
LKSVDGSAWSPNYGKAHLRRLTFDLMSADDHWHEERLFDAAIGDLGDVDPRFIGYQHRYCFGALRPPSPDAVGNRSGPGWVMPSAYARFDVRTRAMVLLDMGPDYVVGECRFVARPGSSDEGAGWLIGVVSNRVEKRSELIVADAGRLQEGPIARAVLPFPAAPQVHGYWAAAGQLPLPAF